MNWIITLRDPEGGREGGLLTFALPLKRAWFEGVASDLHLQVDGYEEMNICPHENDYKDEFAVPSEAKVFIAWLEKLAEKEVNNGIDYEWNYRRTKTTACTNFLESGRVRKAIIPPKEALDDLMAHLVSPNR